MITGLLFLILLGITAMTAMKSITKDNRDNLKVTNGGLLAGLVIATIVVPLAQPFSVEKIDAGNVGVKVSLIGDSRGVGNYEYKTGWVVYNSWFSKVLEFPMYQQHVDYEERQVISKGGFVTTIKPSFNYSLKAGEVGDMFVNLRLDIKEIENKWLQTAIVGAINDVANKWTVDSIFNHREDFENNIIAEANLKVTKWFLISQLRTNITPPKALEEAILAKTKAIQDVQVAENQRAVAVAEGDRKIAEARADSASKVIAAAGEAEAIRRKQLTITPIYIDYIKATTWDGKLPQITGNSMPMINLKD